MKLNQEAIEDIQTLIKDLQNDIFAVDNSHPMSNGTFEDVRRSISLTLSILKEREAEIMNTSRDSLYAIYREIVK